ncbi:uncharacterized protein LOC143049794 isoform X2 [Mytilus galloprovincialis]|uniref:uncharacterized protein LOC143049794 isoform X2 n=1 Tax=Mytilus galloprovincialis TaxID=29158 RepID=UPI003F7C17A6
MTDYMIITELDFFNMKVKLFNECIPLSPLECDKQSENIQGRFSKEHIEWRIQYILPAHRYEDNVRKPKSICLPHAIKTSCIEKEYMLMNRISTTEGDGVNEMKFKKMDRKMKNNSYRTGTSKPHTNATMMYYLLNILMSYQNSRIPNKESFVFQRSAQELTHHIYQRKNINVVSENDDEDEISVEMNRQDTSRTDVMKVQSGFMHKKYHNLTNSMKCQLCVDKNKAVNWCNTCEKNICSFCKLFHQKVWDVMEHDILPLRTVF